MNEENDFALVTRLPSAVEKAEPGAKRILSSMVDDTLALVKKEPGAEVAANSPIGDYEWREPDYRQILIWARALSLEPEEVIRRLLRGEKRESSPEWNETKFIEGVLLKLNWDFELLPLQRFEWIDGLAMTHLGFSSSPEKSPTLSLRLPLLTHLSCSNLGLTELDFSGAPAMTSLDEGRSADLTFGGTSFDEKTYEKSKPHFKEVYEKFVQADKSLEEFFRFIFENFGVSVRPYLKRFIQELQTESKRATNESQPHSTQTGERSLTPKSSGVPMLKDLWCAGNKLIELDIRPLQNLQTLHYDAATTRLIQRPEQNF